MIWWAIVAWLLIVPLLPMSRITLTQLAWARDRWLLGVIGCGLLWLGSVEPALALVALAALAQWKGPDQLPNLDAYLTQVASVAIYASAIVAWFLVSRIPTSGLPLLGWGLAGVSVVHACACGVQMARREPLRGALGQRTFSGGVITLTLPFTWPWGLPVAGAGLILSQSWLAWIAGAAALGMLQPWTLLVSLVAANLLLPQILSAARVPITTHRTLKDVGWLDRVGSRGTSLDSLRHRLAVYGLLMGHCSWRGSGPGSVQRLIARSGAPHGGHAHCDLLEYVVEYGALGVVAVVALLWRVAPHLRLHDPWSAAVVAGIVLILGSTPLRVAQVGGLWWACCAVVGGH